MKPSIVARHKQEINTLHLHITIKTLIIWTSLQRTSTDNGKPACAGERSDMAKATWRQFPHRTMLGTRILYSLSSLICLSGSSLVTLNGWRNSLLTHAYCWQIVPLRSPPRRVICASSCDVESPSRIGKGHSGNRQTSRRGAFEENYIFHG